jgi:hypothetical protein
VPLRRYEQRPVDATRGWSDSEAVRAMSRTAQSLDDLDHSLEPAVRNLYRSRVRLARMCAATSSEATRDREVLSARQTELWRALKEWVAAGDEPDHLRLREVFRDIAARMAP